MEMNLKAICSVFSAGRADWEEFRIERVPCPWAFLS